MPLSARIIGPLLGVLAMGAAACATVPAGSVDANPFACDRDCDPPVALGDGGTIEVEAGEFFFSEPEGLWWAGDISVTLRNIGAAEHDIVFVGANETSDDRIVALGGNEETGMVNLFEGDFVFYCSIPGHRGQGMEGTLTVLPTQDEAETAADS